jgi:ferritin-like metal-binding protein YciE
VSSNEERLSLAATFDRHADQEGSTLAEYRVLAERLGDSSAGMLVNQILTDEEIHHLLLRTIATWLRERGGKATAMIPAGANRAELLRLTHALKRHEHETIEACRVLRPQLSGESAELIGTLLDTMTLDSEKHRRLLEAVEGLLKS